LTVGLVAGRELFDIEGWLDELNRGLGRRRIAICDPGVGARRARAGVDSGHHVEHLPKHALGHVIAVARLLS
jgi:hypothetical protein